MIFPSKMLLIIHLSITCLTADLFILNSIEQEAIVYDYAYMAIRVAVKYFDYFKFLDKLFPEHRSDNLTHLKLQFQNF